ncbi:MAG: carbohydrate kinase family protein [Candidatus Moraniibacteriota bacterium]
MHRVLCIGSASKDIFFPTNEGVILETPDDLRSQTKVAFELGGKFHCRERAEAVGGVAANVAQGLARMGHEAAVYSQVGADDVGNWIIRTLQGAGVQTDTIDIDRTVSTDLSAIIVVQATGDRIIFHNRDANEKLHVDGNRLKPFGWVYVSALNGAWRENLRTILQAAERFGLQVAFNPGQHNLKEDPRLLLESLPHIRALFLNKDEALELLLAGGIENRPERLNDERYLVQKLQTFGPSVVALTDGKRGAWVTDGREVWQSGNYEPRGLVDTTGAGDAFGSGFLSAYLFGFRLEKCLSYGIINAGSVVGDYGASTGLLDQAAVEAYGANVHATLLANQ